MCFRLVSYIKLAVFYDLKFFIHFTEREHLSSSGELKINGMRQNDVHLLIHHHHVAFIVEDGVIWLFSVIGRWMDALADCLGEVILLFYQSEQRLPQQDTPVVRKNVRLLCLGARRTGWNRIFRRNRLRRGGGESNFRMDLNIQKFIFDRLEHMFYNNWAKELGLGILAVFYQHLKI